MKSFLLTGICLTVGLFLILSPSLSGQELGATSTPQTVEELKKAILEVLKETNTSAAGIALVDEDGSKWIEGLGMADVEKGIDADEETMFRIGSTSKIFVALAILKLQEQGKLNLRARVRDIIPEIEFRNAWKDSHPILIEHLLEHTTGWDDIHLVENVTSGEELSLREGLDLHPHSRISRWVPGTRMAYANSGPAVAAYIVEKITGMNYEDYISEEFFEPLGMETMTFFPSEAYKQKGATLYHEGYPTDYWHIIFRPPGAINASAKDMANLVAFFLNRGRTGTTRLISESSLGRMETPSTTLGAKAGLKYGYGLCLYTSVHDGYTFYKHGGGVKGGISDFSYLPEYGVGYSVQINSGNRQAIFRISRLIRDYLTKDLPEPSPPNPAFKATTAYPEEGYYQQINPRNGKPFYIPPLYAERFWRAADTLYSQSPALTGRIEKFIPAGDSLYKSLILNKTNMALVKDPLYGEVLEIAGSEGGTLTLGRVSGTWLLAKIIVLCLWVLFLLIAFLSFPIWAIRYWRGRLQGGVNIWVRIFPLLAGFFVLLSLFFMSIGIMGDTTVLARPSFVSMAIMASTIAFFASAFWSVMVIIRFRKTPLKRSVYLPAAALSVLHGLVAIYLLWHGVIGLQTWA